MNDIKVSVIVPVYKVPERFLRQCIESLTGQTLREIEIILVDDGSPDQCGEICDEYASHDNRIRVIHKKNGGVSSARNAALDICSGEWVLFIDADDWLEIYALSIIYKLTINLDTDIIGFNAYYNKGNRQWKRPAIIPSTICRNKEEIIWFKLDTLFPYYDFKKNGIATGAIRGVGCKFFRRSVIKKNEIRFEEKVKIAEDAIFCYDVFDKSSSIALYNMYLAHYRIHQDSVMRKFNPNIDEINISSLEGYYKRIKLFMEEENFKIAFLGATADAIFRSLKLYYIHPKNKSSLLQRMRLFRNSINNDIYKKAMKYRNIKYLPHGKKEIIYCIQRNWIICSFFFAWLSIIYLRFRRTI